MTVVMGLDPSLTATSAVAMPLDWDGVWARVQSVTAGEPLRRDATDVERVRRVASIAGRVVAFARTHGVTIAYLESYAYGLHTAAHSLGELGGVLRLELDRAGIELRTANLGAARKLLLGSVPRKEAKAAVYAALRAAGAPFSTHDQADAFAAANLGLSELGGYCFAQAEAT